MKILLTLFVLLFSSSVVADDISDFEIEGMSVGNSALDYFTKDEINNGQKVYHSTSNKFFQIQLSSPKFKVYDGISFYFQNNDNTYKIYGIRGAIFFQKNSDECLVKKDEVEKDISLMFKYIERIDHGTWDHPYDKSGKSTVTQVEFLLDIGNDSIVISCYDWSEKITKELFWHDHLHVEMYSKEFANLLRELQS